MFDKDGYFKTGDVAKIDPNGNVALVGRIKEMINRGGESISAVEVEKLIIRPPGCDACRRRSHAGPGDGRKGLRLYPAQAGGQIAFQ